MYASTLLTTLVFGAVATSSPVAILPRVETAAAAIKAIMPTSNSCEGAEFPDECRTADEAAPFLIDAMQKYGVVSTGEIAGVLSLIGLESNEMKYKHNISPGRPGQGTSNMQMISYNQKYASSIPELAGKVAGASDDDVLALVTPDKYNFGSGPWFLTTQCTDDQRKQLQAGTDAGFSAYMSCIGVEATDERLAYWKRAKTAFGL